MKRKRKQRTERNGLKKQRKRKVDYTYLKSENKSASIGLVFGMSLWLSVWRNAWQLIASISSQPACFVCGVQHRKVLKTETTYSISITEPFKVAQGVRSLHHLQHCVTVWQNSKIKTQKQLLNCQGSHEHVVISYHRHIIAHTYSSIRHTAQTHYCYTAKADVVDDTTYQRCQRWSLFI